MSSFLVLVMFDNSYTEWDTVR